VIEEVSNCEARVRAPMLSNLATSLAGTGRPDYILMEPAPRVFKLPITWSFSVRPCTVYFFYPELQVSFSITN